MKIAKVMEKNGVAVKKHAKVLLYANKDRKLSLIIVILHMNANQGVVNKINVNRLTNVEIHAQQILIAKKYF